MPTALIEYKRNQGFDELTFNHTESLVDCLAYALPSIVAPLMNVEGRELHNGGVSAKEIIVDARAYSNYARNINDIQITVRAHRFEERSARLDEITNSIQQSMHDVLRKFNRDLDIGIEVDLVEMGYASIHDGIS